MEEEYHAATKFYEELVQKLKRKNMGVVNKLGEGVSLAHRNLAVKTIKLPQHKAIIPFIQKQPRAGFLVKTPLNLFTKDDPILRYLPTIKTETPAHISWYEGTVIGDKPYDEKDTIDNIFLRSKKYLMDKKVTFLRMSRGRQPLKDYPLEEPTNSMKSLFCGICCIFGCGIHNYNLCNIVKFTENSSCQCRALLKLIKEIPKRSSSETEKLIRRLTCLQARLKTSALKSCVVHAIMLRYCLDQSPGDRELPAEDSSNSSANQLVAKMSWFILSCFTTLKLPIRKVLQATKVEKDPKQFYEPCRHKGMCQKGLCSCVRRNLACEAACSCTTCSNMKYCNCSGCNSACPCRQSDRECNELCRCNVSDNSHCNSRNIFNRKLAAVSVCMSKKHGYGLFSETFIKAGEFVMEYTGEIVSDKEAERRGNFYEINKCSYLFNLSDKNRECLHSIDAFFAGNQSKYINHSRTQANLKATVLIYNGLNKIVFYALRDIFPGEELLFDYQFTESHMLKHGITD